MKATILILEDDKRVQSLLDEVLLKLSYKIIVMKAKSEVLQTISKNLIDVIIVDSESALINDLDISLKKLNAKIPVIYLNCLPGLEIIISKVSYDRFDYFVESFSGETLRNRIELLVKQEEREIIEARIERGQSGLLTPQEGRILSLLSKGYTNKEIAQILGLKVATVRTYNYILYQKLHVHNRTQAIVVAKEANLL